MCAEDGSWRNAMAKRAGKLVVDIRDFDPASRRALVFSVVDTLVNHDCEDQLVFVCDHEPAGLAYQIDLRKETRGKFEFSSSQRSDGAWVALLERR
jgi:uncharacterized protein (DUF2249 family)